MSKEEKEKPEENKNQKITLQRVVGDLYNLGEKVIPDPANTIQKTNDLINDSGLPNKPIENLNVFRNFIEQSKSII